jgi:hypothetical protein
VDGKQRHPLTVQERVGLLELEIHGSGNSLASRIAHLEANGRSVERLEVKVDRLDERLDQIHLDLQGLAGLRSLSPVAVIARHFPGGMWGAVIAAVTVIAAVEVAIELFGVVPLIRAVFRL